MALSVGPQEDRLSSYFCQVDTGVDTEGSPLTFKAVSFHIPSQSLSKFRVQEVGRRFGFVAGTSSCDTVILESHPSIKAGDETKGVDSLDPVQRLSPKPRPYESQHFSEALGCCRVCSG